MVTPLQPSAFCGEVVNRKHQSFDNIHMKVLRLLLTLALLISFVGCTGDPDSRKKKHLTNGNKYFDNGKFNEAAIMYRRALKEDQRFGEAWYKLGLAELKRGRPGEAVNSLRRAVELQPDNNDAFSKLADLYLTAYLVDPIKFKGLLPELKDLANRLTKKNPKSYDALRLNGYIALTDKDVPGALAYFQQADTAKPDQPGLVLILAQTLYNTGKPEEGEAKLKALIVKDKTYYPAYDFLFMVYARANNYAEADKIINQKARDNPADGTLLVNLATHYFLNRKEPEMKAALNKLISDPKTYPNAYIMAGDFYYRIRDFDNAQKTYEAGEKAQKDKHKDFGKRLVEIKVAQNKLPEALALVESLLKEDPTDPDSISMRATLQLYGGKPEQQANAIADMQSVVSKMPENFVLRFNLGRALMQKGDVEAAKVQFQDSIKLRPDYIPPRLALSQIQLSRGEWANAMTSGKEILAVNPNNVSARLIISSALMGTGELKQALVELEQTLKTNPESNDAKYQQAFIYFQEKRFSEAEKIFNDIYHSNPPDIRGLMGITETYMIQGKYDMAMTAVKKEIELHPERTALKIAYGNIAIRNNKVQEAIPYYKEVLDQNPKDGAMYVRMGIAYRQLGDSKNAIEYLRRAVELLPNDATPYAELAMLLHVQGNQAQARPLYEKILKLQPNNEVALNNLAFMIAEEGSDLDQALTLAQRAKQKNPSDANIADTLGWIYIKKNLPDNAINVINELITKNPSHANAATFKYHLAMAFAQKGDKVSAKKALADAMRSKPSEKDAKDIQALIQKLG